MNIGKLLKAKRLSEGLTQREFGRKYGLNHSTISKHEKGTRGKTASSFVFKALGIINQVCPTCNGSGFIIKN